MFTPTATDPPITTISDDERRVLREYVGNCVEAERFEFEEPLMFILVLSGDRPAVTMNPSREQFPDHPWAPQTGLKTQSMGMSGLRAGRSVRKRLEELAEIWRLPELNEFVDGHWEHQRDEATPEKAAQ